MSNIYLLALIVPLFWIIEWYISKNDFAFKTSSWYKILSRPVFDITRTGYVVKKWIFRLALVTILFYGVFILFALSYDLENRVMVSCPKYSELSAPCQNPYYNRFDTQFCLDYPDACKLEMIMPGTRLGHVVDYRPIISGYRNVAIIITILAFVFNHFFFNRGFGLWKKFKGLWKDSEDDL